MFVSEGGFWKSVYDLADDYRGEFHRDPVRFLRKVRRYELGGAVIGVAILGLSVWAIVAEAGNIVCRRQDGLTLQASIVATAFLVIVAYRLLWARVAVSGTLVDPARFPELKEAVTRIAHRMRAPQVDEVRVVDACNAFAMRAPKRGLIGPSRVVVGIGLPLLVRMAPEELDAIIAHELAHHIRGDTNGVLSLNSKVSFWAALSNASRANGITAVLIGLPLKPFLVRIVALHRATYWDAEYQSDRLAAEEFGAAATRSGLQRMTILANGMLADYLRSVSARIHQGLSPTAFFRDMATFAWPKDSSRVGYVLTSVLNSPSFKSSSHPNLMQRLARLVEPVENGGTRRVPVSFAALGKVPEPTAAASLLGERTQEFLEWADIDYARRHGARWQEGARAGELWHRALAAYGEDPADIESSIVVARYLYDLGRVDEALRVLQSAHGRPGAEHRLALTKASMEIELGLATEDTRASLEEIARSPDSPYRSSAALKLSKHLGALALKTESRSLYNVAYESQGPDMDVFSEMDQLTPGALLESAFLPEAEMDLASWAVSKWTNATAYVFRRRSGLDRDYVTKCLSIVFPREWPWKETHPREVETDLVNRLGSSWRVYVVTSASPAFREQSAYPPRSQVPRTSSASASG